MALWHNDEEILKKIYHTSLVTHITVPVSSSLAYGSIIWNHTPAVNTNKNKLIKLDGSSLWYYCIIHKLALFLTVLFLTVLFLTVLFLTVNIVNWGGGITSTYFVPI